MTYLVLARKWRPRSFDTLVGQDHVVRALTHALDTQRLHHAWLFTGTRGVGKTTLSRILAKSLNCEKGITAQPCGQCRACTEIDAGRYVDYVELDAASNRGVEEMTQLLEQAVYAPSSARFKVYMIDEVHMLTGHAFNAMLKTLEEPPPHVKFILATTDPQKIPVTVLSRCLQFNLKHMTVDAIVEHLQAVLGEEKLAFDTHALRLIGQAAGGSMRDALSLTDQAIAYSAGNLTLDAVQGMLGTIDQSHLLRLLQALAAGRAPEVLAVADELASRGLSYAGALADLAVLLSRVAICQRVPGALPSDDPSAGDIAALASMLHPDLLQLYYSIAVHSRSELALAPDEYAGFVMACLRMLSLTPATPPLPQPPPAGGRSTAVAGAPGEASADSTAPAAAPATSAAPASAAVPISAAAPAPAAPVSQEDDGPEIPAWEALPDDAAAQNAAAPEYDLPAGGHIPASPGEEPTAAPPVTTEAPADDRDIDPTEAPAHLGDSDPVEAAADARDIDPTEAPAHVGDSDPVEAAAAARGTAPADAVEFAPAEAGDDIPADLDYESFPDGASAPPADAYGAGDAGAAQAISAYDASDDADAAGWEPVMDDADFNVAALAPLPSETSSASSRAPRLSRMKPGDWPALAASLPLTGLAAELARQSEWLGVDNDTIQLRVAVRSLAATKGQARLRTVLTEHFGKVVQLKVEFGVTGAGTAHAVEQQRRAQRQKEAESAVANDGFVRSLIEEFGARVMPGSIAAIDDEKVA